MKKLNHKGIIIAKKYMLKIIITLYVLKTKIIAALAHVAKTEQKWIIFYNCL